MAARRAKIQFYWVADPTKDIATDDVKVNWRLVGANGEIMCQSTQGYRDKIDARRAVRRVAEVLNGLTPDLAYRLPVAETGPGKKPEA